VGGIIGYFGHSTQLFREMRKNFGKIISQGMDADNKNLVCLSSYSKNTASCDFGSNARLPLLDTLTHNIEQKMTFSALALKNYKESHDLVLNSQFLNSVKASAKANTAWICSNHQNSECGTLGTSVKSLQVADGMSPECLQKVVNGEEKGGLLGRWLEVVHSFRTLDDSLFIGNSKFIGAAVVVCATIVANGEPESARITLFPSEGKPMAHDGLTTRYKESISKLQSKEMIDKMKGLWDDYTAKKISPTVLMEPNFDCSKDVTHSGPK